MNAEPRDKYEDLERTLDPHRAEELKAAAAEAADRLRSRGVAVRGADTPDDLANLLTAVEQFEAAVKRHGGDLMVDDLKSAQPDDRHFVLPRRKARENIPAYVERIQQATTRLHRHPRHTD